MTVRVCLHCGKVLLGRTNQKYCNNACKCNYRYNLTRALPTKLCLCCGEVFTLTNNHPLYKFCSTTCKDKFTKAKDSYKHTRRLYQLADRIANPTKYKVRDQKRYQENKPQFYAANARRRSAQTQQTPLWETELTQFILEEAHVLRQLRNKLTNVEWHVDHIIPLKGKLVSGLHVWNNFAVIPAILNLKKSNKYAISEERCSPI